MGLKDKVKGMRIVHECWSASEDEALAREGRTHCIKSGCPYAYSDDCTVDAIVDATALVDKLWKKLKKAKRNGGGTECSGQH